MFSDRPAPAAGRPLLTIGHSNHAIGQFLGLLARHRVETVADVRSVPYSRFAPQYRKEALARASVKEMVTPRQLADAILFLASPRSRTTSGQAVSVCGDLQMLS